MSPNVLLEQLNCGLNASTAGPLNLKDREEFTRLKGLFKIIFAAHADCREERLITSARPKPLTGPPAARGKERKPLGKNRGAATPGTLETKVAPGTGAKAEDIVHKEFVIFCGTASRRLGTGIAQALEQTIGSCLIARFPDGEVNVRLGEPIRGREVYLVQSTSPPVDENLVELLALADACRRASASRITAVVPYYGYGRADKRNGQRAPVTGRMVATLLEAVGVDHILTVDLHAPQIEGFFQVPLDTLTAVPALCHGLQKDLQPGTVVVSPDEGRVKMAADFAGRLHAPMAVLHKERRSASLARVTHLVGEVQDRPCLIIDDMISTGGTILEATQALLNAGALPGFLVAATHGLFTQDALGRLNHASIQKIVVSDSVGGQHHWPNLKTVSLAPLLAAAIRRFQAGQSIGDLFDHVIHGGFEETLSLAL